VRHIPSSCWPLMSFSGSGWAQPLTSWSGKVQPLTLSWSDRVRPPTDAADRPGPWCRRRSASSEPDTTVGSVVATAAVVGVWPVVVIVGGGIVVRRRAVVRGPWVEGVSNAVEYRGQEASVPGLYSLVVRP